MLELCNGVWMFALSLPLVERSLWLFNLILSGVLAARLLQLKLARTYRFFVAYLLFSVIRGLLSWSFSLESIAYRNIWRATQPIIWLLYVLVVLELCSLVFKEYRGIQALGRWAIYGSLAVSVCLSTITLVPAWLHSQDPAFSLQRYLMVERGIDFGMVLLLLLILGFLILFPIQLSRNVIVHSVLYTVFFMSGSMATLLVNVTGNGISIAVSCGLMGISLGCLIAWMALITRKGEVTMMAIRKPLVTASEDRLIEQLANINATLLRASKKHSAIYTVRR
jgi:hypothetical protein